jgi:hypothetical protein
MVTLYHSDTDKTKGWWVLAVPTASGFQQVKVLRDSTISATDAAILEALASVVPADKVELVRCDVPTPAGRCWRGEAVSVAVAA